RSQVGGDTERLRITLERELRYLHDAALVGGLRRIEEIRAGVTDIDLRLETVALERDGHAIGLAAARSGSHEDGGGFAPKLKLDVCWGLEVSMGPPRRHHDAGRPAGELGALVKMGRRGRECRQIGHEPLLEAQSIAAVLVIAAHATAFAVAALAVA